MKNLKIYIGCLVGLSLLGCGNPSQEEQDQPTVDTEEQDLNIIFMVGDGMGIAQVSSAFYFGEEQPHFEQFENIGLSITSSTSHRITDSAAGATAFATGHKTYKRAIGVSNDSIPQPSILTHLQGQGYQTGLVSLTSITHATPASFYAHVKDRDQHEDIAQQLVEANIDFIAGGGSKYFDSRSDGLNLLDSLRSRDYNVDTTALAKADPSLKNAYILAEDGLPAKTQGREGFLQEATKNGLDYFSANEEPFFFMIEGSYIDWGGHAMDAEMMIQEVLDFDATIGVVLEFIEANPNTLLVVTADHETGGVSLGKSYDDNGREIPQQVQVYFNSDQHSTELVPVFAKGKGAELFRGIYENTEIYHKLLEVLNQQANGN